MSRTLTRLHDVWPNCLKSMKENLPDRNDRMRNKIIAEPHELYIFLATLSVEVTNVAFASNEVVCLWWKLSAEELVTYLRHTNEVIGAYVRPRIDSKCMGISTGSERILSIVTNFRLIIQSRAGPWPIVAWDILGSCILKWSPQNT